jgi:Outer membrane lipoprotein-sorting protein
VTAMHRTILVLALLAAPPAAIATDRAGGTLQAPPGSIDPGTPAGMLALLQALDERERNQGDWKALCYLEQKEKGKTDQVSELLVYRRDADEKQMFLFTKPKSEAGKGYLRIEKNLWMYDPSTGRWERRTERERIGGSDSRRSDLSASQWAVERDGTFEAAEKLGSYQTWKVTLTVKPGIDVAYPVVKLWIDQASLSILKEQDVALSGKLMRTVYQPRWKKVYSPSKKGDVWTPEEIRIFDEIEKENQTLVVIKEIDLRPLEANLFTKAWLESKSR